MSTKRSSVPHGEVTHIALVQFYGYIESTDDADRAARARSFTNFDDAKAWTDKHVLSAHGGELTTSKPLPSQTMVTSSEGPTWGLVVDLEIRM